MHCVGDNGETAVIEAGPQFRVVARNALAGLVQASPAISGGRIYIRTDTALYAVGAAGGH